MQYEEKKTRPEAAAHHVILEGRERLSVSGVEDVESFDESAIVMNTCEGTLVVRGEGLQVEGSVDSLTYEDAGGERGGFLARLFR